jgi:hypothetical protein
MMKNRSSFRRTPIVLLSLIAALWSFGELRADSLAVPKRKSLQFEEKAPTKSERAPASVDSTVTVDDQPDDVTEAAADCILCSQDSHRHSLAKRNVLQKLPIPQH